MIKRLLSQLPLLGFGIGLILLFPPEFTSNHGNHNHSIYLLSVFVPAIIFFVFILRITNVLRKIKNLRLMILVSIVLLVATHFLPQSTISKFHHQSVSSIEHPCCMSQIFVSAQEVKIAIIIEPFSEVTFINPSSVPQVSVMSFNSRSPPIFS